MREFAGNFVYVSRRLSCCIGRKLLKKASFRPAWGLIPGEFTVYKKGRSDATTHELNQKHHIVQLLKTATRLGEFTVMLPGSFTRGWLR